MTRIKRITPFFLRTPDRNREEAPLYIRVQDKSRGIDVKFNTDIRVDVPEWIKACEDISSFSEHRKKYRELHQKLWEIECVVNEALKIKTFDKDTLSLSILKISDSARYTRKVLLKAEEDNALKELERVQKEYRVKEQAKEEAIRSNIWNFLVRFCSEIESGQRRNRSERYTTGSVKSWKSFKNLYNRFDPKQVY